MKINKQHFLDALTKVKPGIANKEIVEQSNTFIFDDDKIWTYNDEVYVCHKFKTGISGAIKAHEFYKLITKINQEQVEVECDDQVKITAEDFEAIINVSDITLEPVDIPATNSKKWEKLPGNFTDAVTFCTFSASRNMIRPELTCIYITDDVAVSCDSYRGTKYKMNNKIEDSFLIPASVAKHFSLYNPTKYIVGENWIHFINNENTTFSFRVIATEYPENIWDFFDVEGNEIELPEGMADIIQRVETLVTEEFDQDRYLTVTISKDKMECKGEGPLGWVKESTKIDYKKKESIEIKVHPRLMADILTHASSVELGERLKFKTDKFEHCICQFQTEEDDE